MATKKNKDEFIELAKLIHDNKYNYDFVIYVNTTTKVKIFCYKHGEFEQTPKKHLKKQGCKKCANLYLDINLFIEKSNIVHENKYDYSNSIYINARSKIEIICKKHGSFWINSNSHISNKTGCSKCSKKYCPKTDEFVKRANEIHNNKYNYNNVIYVNSITKIKIKCLNHGFFEQRPTDHINQKQGCPKCIHTISKPEIEWLNYLNIEEKYRQKTIFINNKKYNFDACNNLTKTIYEFYGDYWHGNPEKFKSDNLNKNVKKTFGELYERTINRENYLKSLGYTVISIWENDWCKIKNTENVINAYD